MPTRTDTEPQRSAPLRAARGFGAYWTGEAASLTGSSAHAVALPVIAAVELRATPDEVALLASAALVPAVLLGLPAGVAGDRLPKRRLMMVTDLAAAAVVAAVPLSWAAGLLTMPLLWGAALALGALSVAHQAASIASCRNSSNPSSCTRPTPGSPPHRPWRASWARQEAPP